MSAAKIKLFTLPAQNIVEIRKCLFRAVVEYSSKPLSRAKLCLVIPATQKDSFIIFA
jgi:hypothetical protein